MNIPKIHGINHKKAIRVFEKLGYKIVRQSGHIVMSNGIIRLTLPRKNPINAIARDAGLSPEKMNPIPLKLLLPAASDGVSTHFYFPRAGKRTSGNKVIF